MEVKLIIFILCLYQFTIGSSYILRKQKSSNVLTDEEIEKYRKEGISSYDFINVAKEDVTFRLWTYSIQNNYTQIFQDKLASAPFLTNKPFKFIIHGYGSSAGAQWVQNIKNEYLKLGAMNIIAVDWSKPAGSVFYPLSAAFTKGVGLYLGQLILAINKIHRIPFANIHLIGHSLGAHVSGFAGKVVRKFSMDAIRRITALDPAGPLFVLADPPNRLTKFDARVVDVIHSDGAKLGYSDPIGTIDFYPNGGYAPQPGCVFYDISDIITCSHGRSHEYFIESIASHKFIASACDNIQAYLMGFCKNSKRTIMGANVDMLLFGNFYLTTNAATPFARNGQI